MGRLKAYYLGLFAAAAVLFSSCGSSAHIEKDPAVNLASYRTYSWIHDDHASAQKSHINDMAEQKIKSAVDAQLEKNGWREVRNNGDVLLSYDLVVDKTVSHQSDPVYSQPFTRLYFNPYTRRYGTIYYPSQFLGYDEYNVPVREGTVMITMVDPRLDKTIWQGWATRELSSNRVTADDVQKTVKSIFKKFEVASR